VTRPLFKRRDLLKAAPSAAFAAAGCTTREPAPTPGPTATARPLVQVVPGMSSRDGAGVKLSRTLGSRALPLLDPFLMLDEIRSDDPADYVAGFPRHPHRGFETVTFMMSGALEHKDSVGNTGLLAGGSVQWMTAGRGIIHSEMPLRSEGLLWGLQLWVNLPKRLKMSEPRYQDIAPKSIPAVSLQGAEVRVLAGFTGGTAGPVEGIAVAPTVLDVTIAAGATFEHALPGSNACFAYVLEGGASFGGAGPQVARGELAVLGTGASVLAGAGPSGTRLLLAAAEPIGEPVARRGPFVMNTDEEIEQAFDDYRAGRLTEG
jgi:hypothetical protein